MQDVARLEQVVVVLAHLEVEIVDRLDVVRRVELTVRTRVHEAPGPLLRDDAHRLVGRRQVLLHVVPDADRRSDDQNVAQDDHVVRPGDPTVLGRELARDVLRLDAVLLPEAEDEVQEDALDEHEPERDDDPEDEVEDEIDVAAVARRDGREELIQRVFDLSASGCAVITKKNDGEDPGHDARHRQPEHRHAKSWGR